MSTDPRPVYNFILAIGLDEIAFGSVSGLELGFDLVEYTDGNEIRRRPGRVGAINITFRAGTASGDSPMLGWLTSAGSSQIDKRDITINRMSDGGGGILMTWKVSNAVPTKCTAPVVRDGTYMVMIDEVGLLGDKLELIKHG